MPNKFQAPNHTEELLDSVADRCQNLIDSNVWDIKKGKLKSWINNFKSDKEKYLCALLLDAFMYRSDSMIESLCQHAVCSILYNSCVNKSIGSIEDWAYSFQHGKAKDFAFVAVEGIKNGERESGKSGQLVI
ncbi:MAG: hypothetical protein MI866_07025, partial [Bacteroidales bacterium]|nr:hypothetical protein [Bacteroidales bacterium]